MDSSTLDSLLRPARSLLAFSGVVTSRKTRNAVSDASVKAMRYTHTMDEILSLVAWPVAA